jgi:hypothetical protein
MPDYDALADIVIMTIKRAQAPLLDRITLLEANLALVESYASVGELAGLRERIARLETRAPVPGPPGADGKDGADGLGIDDLRLEQRDERTMALAYVRGSVVKDLGVVTWPIALYRGVHVEGKAYDAGDTVTWAGSVWYCKTTTTARPGEGHPAWMLMVKRGRDGKGA